jgi:UDP-N-acetylmuramate dehydrogenase
VLEIREDVPLAPLTTFGIGGPARFFAKACSEPDVVELLSWANEKGLPAFVLGGGSNLLVPDAGFDGLVMQMDIRGVEQDKPCSPHFSVGAGDVWDIFVDAAIAANCTGIECLAGIPGRVGGTPVQNVGAYGQEVAETIEQVRVFDRETSAFRWMTNHECRFRYRESIFNTTARGRYVVSRVVFHLHYGKPELKYADLKKRFENRDSQPGPSEVAQAVREIRRSKGMLLVAGDPDCNSAGSFFKNPIVPAGQLQAIQAVHGSAVPHWSAGDGLIKLPAAWLLEHAGFVKGFRDGAVGLSTRHTLALVNLGGARFSDVTRLERRIIEAVHQKYGITLEREPVLLA